MVGSHVSHRVVSLKSGHHSLETLEWSPMTLRDGDLE